MSAYVPQPLYTASLHRLTTLYGREEGRALLFFAAEKLWNFTPTDILGGALDLLATEEKQRWEKLIDRLMQHEPVQYVVEKAEFGQLDFYVRPGVLIPRPETFALCRLVQDTLPTPQSRIFDICTGSGCIAVTLKKRCPETVVTACDISPEALDTAQANIHLHNVAVELLKADALHLPPTENRWDVIVSNPPYIARSESKEMAPNVLLFEPELALFVSDEDPLCFYRAIAGYAQRALKPGGKLYFELNANYVDACQTLVKALGFTHVECSEDPFGKPRFLHALRP